MQLSYLSRTRGIGGSIKNKPEDFIVEEISNDGTMLEIDKDIVKGSETGEFTHFVLQKTDWSTADAIKEIAKRLGVSQTRFNFAGTKDKNAITVQLVSVFGVTPEQLRDVRIKDIRINGAWHADERIKLGELAGNRFIIKVNGANERAEATVEKIYNELNGKIPNYFGEQRFGTTRRNTHLVGEKIIKGDFEGAVMAYLTDSEGEANAEASAARKELAATLDFNVALKTFPKYLRLERSMLAHLSEKPGDHIGALRKLPRNILLMFVHAFQSMLFNEMLSERIKAGELKAEEGEYFCGENGFGFPDIETKKESSPFIAGRLIGYETEINEREYDILQKHGIKRINFRIKQIPEISSKGSYRALLAPLKSFSFADNTFRFSLPAGSYATVAIREFLNREKQ